MKPLNDETIEEGAQCPGCGHGLVAAVDFGVAGQRERFAWCEGLEGDRDSGCGWEEIYKEQS